MAATVPKGVAARISVSLKKFQPILKSALDRDVNESDTVDIITDILDEMFGYNKYVEVTSEYKIRGTYCDLAIEIEGRLWLLIEVKAIGLDLKDNHMRQAVNYAANQGVDWVALTNGYIWKIYKVVFTKPIKTELVLEINLLNMNPRNSDDINTVFLLAREGLKKSTLPDYFAAKQATNRFVIAAILRNEPILKAVRKELRKISPDIKVDEENIKRVIEHEVLKREVAEGEKANEAQKAVEKALRAEARKKTPKKPVKAAIKKSETPNTTESLENKLQDKDRSITLDPDINVPLN
ncbi:MAG: type I restriction enzyme HsdR N-terminal domain-containing protein [Actinobacteria bacterium]|nr:type I restriction enzyme HsdR N-terminal domain-containing protein [Actinomycetota bacterium]